MASNTENRSKKYEVNNDLNSANSDFKDKFQAQLKDFYFSQSGTVKKPWTNERILEVIMYIKTGKEAMGCGVKRSPTQYYWCKKYDLMNVDGEDYLVLKKNNPEGKTIRIVPLEQYFDHLLEVHKESGHGGRDKMLHAIKNRLYIQKKAIEIFVSLCPTCESKRNLRELPRKLADKASGRDSGFQNNPSKITTKMSQVCEVIPQSHEEIKDSTVKTSQNNEFNVDQIKVSPILTPIKVEMDELSVHEEFVDVVVEPLQNSEFSVDPLKWPLRMASEHPDTDDLTAGKEFGDDKIESAPVKKQKVDHAEKATLPVSQSPFLVTPSMSQPVTMSGVEPIALVWSSKLQALEPVERLHVEKAINDVLFDALLKRLGNGERSSGH